MARIVGVLSGKGGVGKTTLVVNVGIALAHFLKKKVTVIDTNLTTSHLGLALGLHHAQENLNRVLRGEIMIDEALHKHHTGLSILPASLRLQDLEGVDLSKMRPMLKELAKDNDFIILDAGPGLGREALSALHSSQEIVFVATPTLPSVMDVLRYLEFMKSHQKKHLGVVLNMVQKNESQLLAKEIENMLSLPIITSIPRDSSIPKSLAAEVPAVLAYPDSVASKEFVNVARHIAGLPIERIVKETPLNTIRRNARELFEKLRRFPSLE